MKCLETRRRNGMKWRRYRLPNGRTITTYELPESVLRSFQFKRVLKKLEAFQAGEAMRDKHQEAVPLIEAGWKVLAISHQVGVDESTIRRWKRELYAQRDQLSRNQGGQRLDRVDDQP